MTQDSLEQQEQARTSVILDAWKAIGEELFADGESIIVPKIETVRTQAELFAIEVALIKHNGNITHAGKELGTSRRALRDKLKKANRYPWHPMWSLEFTAT